MAKTTVWVKRTALEKCRFYVNRNVCGQDGVDIAKFCDEELKSYAYLVIISGLINKYPESTFLMNEIIFIWRASSSYCHMGSLNGAH